MKDFDEHTQTAAEQSSDAATRTGAQRLFQMVVALAVCEALGHAQDNSLRQRQARNWIFTDQDFRAVCELADLDAERIRQQTQRFIQEGRVSCLLNPDTGRAKRRSLAA